MWTVIVLTQVVKTCVEPAALLGRDDKRMMHQCATDFLNNTPQVFNFNFSILDWLPYQGEGPHIYIYIYKFLSAIVYKKQFRKQLK